MGAHLVAGWAWAYPVPRNGSGRHGEPPDQPCLPRRARPGIVAAMETRPVNLDAALAQFDEIYSPRIIGRVNDYDIRVAHTQGEHVWHTHDHTDEFFLVLSGQFNISLRDADGPERTIELQAGEMFVVPRGTEHKPSSPGGAILMFEPSGTSSTGDRHEGDIPAHVHSTTGVVADPGR
jgi:mannose-6-phosphate isomerase-like protein (cupin superfamily)